MLQNHLSPAHARGVYGSVRTMESICSASFRGMLRNGEWEDAISIT